MTRQYIFLAHGMGTYPDDKWSKGFKQSFLQSLKLYKPYKGLDDAEIEAKHVRFVTLNYDSIFEGFRERWKTSADGVKKAMAKEWAAGQEIFNALAESGDGSGEPKNYFWSHLLDALLWYTLPDARKAVIPHVNEQITKALAELYDKEPSARAHVIAHSLGTSVMHDCLVSLRKQPKFKAFQPGAHRWATIVAVANVSRLLQAPFKLDQAQPISAFEAERSALSPVGPGALCDNFVNARHRADPFTWPRQFRPTWPTQHYSDIELLEYKSLETVHDFDTYFENPRLHLPVFWNVFGNLTLGTMAQRDAAQEAFDTAHPSHASSEFEHLRGLFGADVNTELDPVRLAEFLYQTYRELHP